MYKCAAFSPLDYHCVSWDFSWFFQWSTIATRKSIMSMTVQRPRISRRGSIKLPDDDVMRYASRVQGELGKYILESLH